MLPDLQIHLPEFSKVLVGAFFNYLRNSYPKGFTAKSQNKDLWGRSCLRNAPVVVMAPQGGKISRKINKMATLRKEIAKALERDFLDLREISKLFG